MIMRTYVADIDGVPTIAFRAHDDEHAQALADDKAGDLRLSLGEFNKPDGSSLWDGVAAILVRPASDAEDTEWLKARDASVGRLSEGAIIDPELGEDPDEFSLYLVPIVPAHIYDDEGVEDDDEDEDDDAAHE
jgi:hypothetical protein